MGFRIRSGLPFQTLRAGGGAPLLVETLEGPPPEGETLIVWKPRPGNPFHGRLASNGTRYSFWASDAGWYVIDTSVPSISVEHGADLTLLQELRLFGIPASLCGLERGDISVHASAVEIDGQGVLFAGPSMHGKTTLAAGFARAGHRLLSEDTARCTTSAMPAVYPGPAVARLRADVARRLDVVGARGQATGTGRRSLVFDVDRRGDGSPVPLRAIVLLRGGNEIQLTPTPKHQAARDLFALTFRLPTVESRAAGFARVVDLAAGVDVLDLVRPLTVESLDEVVGLVEAYVSRPRTA